MRRASQNIRQGRWLLVPLGRQRQPVARTPSFPRPARQETAADKQERNKYARSVLEGSSVALISLFGLGLGGYAYSEFYKRTVRQKIENAFSAGYSSQERVALGRISYGNDPAKIQEMVDREYWVPRPEQDEVTDIVSGRTKGRYHLIIGERGYCNLTGLL